MARRWEEYHDKGKGVWQSFLVLALCSPLFIAFIADFFSPYPSVWPIWIIGGWLTCGVLFLFVEHHWFLWMATESAEGTVVDFVESVTDETNYYALVGFQAYNQDWTAMDNRGTNPPLYKIEQQVTVRFPPGKPTKARIVMPGSRSQPQLIVLLLALVLVSAWFLYRSSCEHP